MKMKILVIIAVILGNIFGMQSQGVLFDKQNLSAIESKNDLIQDAAYVFDGIYPSNNNVNNSSSLGTNWMQINTKCIRKVSSIKLYTSSSNFYVFLSKSPFFHSNVEALIRDPWVKYYNVTNLDGGSHNYSYTIPVNDYIFQYMMIISTNVVHGSTQGFHINEIDIYGNYADCGPYFPPQNPPIIGPPVKPPYGTCGPWIWPPNNPPILPPYIIGTPWLWVGPTGVWPWWSSQEICGDGKDNDDNGLIDCEDYPCGVGTFNVVQTNPTCPICLNGKICIYANNNVKSVSIDDGVTWVAFPTDGFYCFENLNSGPYKVKLRTEYGCEDGKEIILIAPEGEEELCENGGFESGDFTNWEGGTASGYNINFGNNTTLDLNNRHTIIGNPFIDPFSNTIQGYDGTYSAKLGNSVDGAQSERLKYCFGVTNANKDFSFNYAAVLEIPKSHGNNLPFFSYRIFNELTGETISTKMVDTNNPFAITVETEDEKLDNVSVLSWQCESVDLSSLVGRRVCAEFISSDCGCGAHFGYGYVDGLCTPPSSSIDTKIIFENNIVCKNQKIKLSVNPSGYNRYKWRISKIDMNGNETDVYTGPITIGAFAEIKDLKQYYEQNSNFTLNCGFKIKVVFESLSDCSSGQDEIILEYKCDEYNIDYCNPMYYCLGANTNLLQIKGINNCDNCRHTWSSPQGLAGMTNTTSKFPILDRSLNSSAFDKVYNVEVKTPEGCIYEDTFKAINRTIDKLNVDPIVIGYCDYNISGNIILTSNVPNNILICKAINTLDGSMEILQLTGTGLTRTFNKTISREFASKYRIEVDFVDDYFCKEGNCSKFINLNLVNASPYFKSWKAIYPNVFCGTGCPRNTGSGNSKFFLLFNTIVNNNCSVVNQPVQSSIYYYDLKIYDRWGNLVFEGSSSKLPTDVNGVLGDEVKWDGTFDGVAAAAGVYTWTARVKSCYYGNNNCNDCSNQSFNYCSKGKYDADGYEIFAGDITLIN